MKKSTLINHVNCDSRYHRALYSHAGEGEIVMNIRETMRASRLFVAVTIFILVLFAIYFVVPLYVMLVNSFKPLSEIRAGNMLAFPEEFSFDFWK